jgi:hypothetical protein
MYYGFDLAFVVMGGLSCLGALAVIGTYACFHEVRSTSFRLLVYLAACDLGQGLFFCIYLGNWLTAPWLCVVHHAWGVWVALSSFLWTTCIAYYVYSLVSRPIDAFSASKLKCFHALCWGYPSAVVVVFLLLSYHHTQVAENAVIGTEEVYYDFRYPVSGGQEGWFRCMDFSPSSRKLRTQFSVFNLVTPIMLLLEYALPLLVCVLVTTYYYLAARQKLPLMSTSEEGPAAQNRRLRMILIPLIFVLTRSASFAYVVWYAITQRPGPLWLIWCRAFLDPTQGFLNGLCFTVLNPQIWPLWKARLCRAGPSSCSVIATSTTPPIGLQYGTLASAPGCPDLGPESPVFSSYHQGSYSADNAFWVSTPERFARPPLVEAFSQHDFPDLEFP